jgi:hypothetical protein
VNEEFLAHWGAVDPKTSNLFSIQYLENEPDFCLFPSVSPDEFSNIAIRSGPFTSKFYLLRIPNLTTIS